MNIIYDDAKAVAHVRRFVEKATADGWGLSERYKGETVEQSGELRKDGFLITYLARDAGKYKSQASISGWGPDGLVIKIPSEYNGDKIKDAVNFCNYCGKRVEKTVRISFAGRCCEPCRPELAKTMERPGWDD